MVYDLLIIGSGAAGLSAALYAGRYLMKTLIVEGDFGGETAKAGVIWNYPGRKGIDGFDLMLTMREQASENGAKFADGKVTSIKKNGNCVEIVAGGKTYTGKTVLLSMGAERRHLGLPNEKELTGKGVHYCVTCDGPIYTGKTIALVGGGDASVKGINLAAQYVKKAYLITREKELNAEPINIQEMKALGEKIEIISENQVEEIIPTADGKFDKVILKKPFNGSTEMKVDGLFVEIGAEPNREIPQQMGVITDEAGYVTVDNTMATNIPGVFAAGDATHFFGRFKQDITAAAQGAVAATTAYEYIKHNPNICELHAAPEA
jgi:thioredoxin reductase (NADPH)